MKCSAGIVVHHFDRGEWRILMLRCGKYWDFPKGCLEEGEEWLDAAMRETREETGITDLSMVFHVESNYHIFHETRPYSKPPKVARYYIGITSSDKVVLTSNDELGFAEHDEYRWLTYEEAIRLPLNPRILSVVDWVWREMV